MQRCQGVFSHVHTWRTSHNTLLDIIYEKSMKCQVYSSPRKYSNCKCNRTDQIMWTLEWEASWDMYLETHWLALCSRASSQFTWWVRQQEQIQFSVDIAYDKNLTLWKFFCNTWIVVLRKIPVVWYETFRVVFKVRDKNQHSHKIETSS